MTNEKYQFHSFLTYKNIVHGISLKTLGSMKRQDDQQIDRKKLALFAKSLGINDKIICMRQIHSGTVSLIDDLDHLQISETDGLMSNKKHIPLAVLTADCLPILFFDPKNEAIGIAHAGYKGLLSHIIENMIHRFVSSFKSDPKDILVGVGPSIEMTCYEVGEELIDQFQKTFPKFKNTFVKKDGQFYLGLREIAEQCFEKEGILKENIEVMDICTKCDINFYSYRSGDKDGRFVSIISLV